MHKLFLSLLAGALLSQTASAQVDSPNAAGVTTLASSSTQLLRLRDGNVLWGAIESHTSEGIGFRRLETGGRLTLPWAILDPTEEQDLRLRFGYVDSQSDELLVQAHRLTLNDGREIVGEIINRTDTDIWVKRAEGTVPVPKVRIRGAAQLVLVPALDIYTKDELYQKRLSELQVGLLSVGRSGARAHDELAQYCEQLFDYVHALEHYRAVTNLAPDYDAVRVKGALSRAEIKAALQEQVDFLARIDLMRARKQYGQALDLLDEFPLQYPDSALLQDWNRLRGRVGKNQERDARALVVKRWQFWAGRLAREAARRLETYAEVIDYLDETMGLDILAAVRQDLVRIDPVIEDETVRRLWDEREGGRYSKATYGTGTWLLGPESAQDLLQPDEEDKVDPTATPGSAKVARKRFEDKINRYLKNIELSRRSQQGGTGDADPEQFWNAWNLAGRYQWIHAYYVENSGDFRDLKASLSSCRECGGKGFKDVLFTGSAVKGSRSGEYQVPCPTCHTVQVVRRLRFR